MVVDSIDAEPGQPGLRLRDTLVEINGTTLVELSDEEHHVITVIVFYINIHISLYTSSIIYILYIIYIYIDVLSCMLSVFPISWLDSTFREARCTPSLGSYEL